MVVLKNLMNLKKTQEEKRFDTLIETLNRVMEAIFKQSNKNT
jgi:RNAse (barnase) inhibitor barstar